MSLAMLFNWLVRWRMSLTNGRRISLVSISQLPIEVAQADVPQPDVVDHVGLPVADDAGGDDPVHELAVAGIHQVVGGVLRELAALPAGEDREDVPVELLVDMPVERCSGIMRHAAGC